MSSKITRRHIPEGSHFRIKCITVYYVQKPLNTSEYKCITVYYVQKPLNISEYKSRIRSFGRLNVLIISRILHTVVNLQTYDVCECSCLQWICTDSVC